MSSPDPAPGPGDAALADLLHELGALKSIRRSGWWLAGIRDPESVAEHVFRTAAVAYFLARIEGADTGKVLAMAIFHDAAETRTNDMHRLGKRYADWQGVEAKVALDQTRDLGAAPGTELRALLDEARAKTSLEARVVKDADVIECLLQAREYAAAGHPVQRWIDRAPAELVTESGKRIARAILATRPGRWWEGDAPGSPGGKGA